MAKKDIFLKLIMRYNKFNTNRFTRVKWVKLLIEVRDRI